MPDCFFFLNFVYLLIIGVESNKKISVLIVLCYILKHLFGVT